MSPNDETRQRQVMLTLGSLIILVMAGFVAGLIWWPELMLWSSR